MLATVGLLGSATMVAASGRAAASPAATTLSAAPEVALHVVGNQLVDAAGRPVQLVGVDRSGTEYACVQGWGIFDGPSDAASVQAIASWHLDAVRIPLNEDCWLGINGVDPAYSGANYRNAIAHYVATLNAAGIVAVLDLHWGAPGTALATSQEPMPDAAHAPAFWTSVATTFRSTPGVVFDLFNEPHGVSWSCWRNGCTLPDGTPVVGMQQLLDAVRATGATQPVMAEGLNWGGDLSGWLAHQPTDPAHNLVASVHLYNFSACNTVTCWNQTIAPVAAAVPVVTGELGETDCGTGFIDAYMPWADSHGISYLAWAWDTGGGWSCSNGPSLITSYDGSPNQYGAAFQAHAAALAAHPVTPPASSEPPATPGTAAAVTARVSQSWGNGAVVDLQVTDTGRQPIGTAAHPWTLRFALPTATTITDMWNADLTTQGGGAIRAVAPPYTPVLEPGASIDVGWVEQGAPDLPSQVAVTDPPGSLSGPALSTTYQLTQSWGDSGNAAITVVNTGTETSAPWHLTFTLPSDTTITVMWCGQLLSQLNGVVTANGPSWARTLTSGQSDTVGFTQTGGTAAPRSVQASA
jgi:hypothetical protein